MLAAMNPSPPAESSFIVNYLGQKSVTAKDAKETTPPGVPFAIFAAFFASFAVTLFHF
jgi:hypothetical protein